ncbi:MAG TPA: TonB-dependent receptor [Steroidobacteraceae bacterium]|nr:TonB-dependent receptor [Steroidobacteraceae bacterium]
MHAQTDSSASPTTDWQLEEVTVSANRYLESSQRVPLAIAAVSANTALKAGVTDPQSLSALVPGLLFNRQANASIPFLRGVGSPVGQSGDEPSVALYVDDVYSPAGSASMASFNSLDHIEVAKGPQGTLFGRNATGGVVQVFTRNPMDEPELELRAGYGNFDSASADLYANAPLTKTLLANVAAYWSDQSEGWGRNITTGARAFRSREYGARVKFLWNESDRSEALLTLDFDKTIAQQGLGFMPFAGTRSLGGFSPASGYYDPSENFDSDGDVRQYGASLKLTHDFEWARLVSVSAYRDTRNDYVLDEDTGPAPIVNVELVTPETTFTQELQLISRPGASLTWIAGLFYFNDEAGFNPIRFTGAAFTPLPFVKTYGILSTESYAVFAQATATIFSDTHLTAGARYTWDDRKVRAGAFFGDDVRVPAPNSPRSNRWSSPTWRLALDRQFTPDTLAYLGYSRGFKSGLYNPVALPGDAIDAPVDPETLDAYTIGLKSEYLGRKLRVNVEGFYYDYNNIQVTQILSAVSHITNAARATIKGIDLDITALPIDGLTLTASLEAMQGRYESFPDGTFFVYDPANGGNCTFAVAPPPAPVPCGGVLPPNYNAETGHWDLKGNHTIQTPPFSLSLSSQYELPTRLGRFDLNLSWTHTGNYFASADNGRGQIAPSSPDNGKQTLMDVLNASLGWTSRDAGLAARLWVKNLTDERYWSYADEISFATLYSPAPPRTIGLTITKRFE